MKKKIVFFYILLLFISFIFEKNKEAIFSVPDSYETVNLYSARGEEMVTMAYREFGDENKPKLVLIHGSPISSSSLEPLISLLESRYHLLVPDLPGFRPSSYWIPDYSIQSHAHYLEKWLKHMDVGPVHILGYSMGGGVALEYIEDNQDRVKSLIMLSSIGVQEHELLGDYFINHSLHALQLGVLSLIDFIIPDFGYLKQIPINTAYARNFFDTDQRPLRNILNRLNIPTLILHGNSDHLVPPSAAKEHYRIVPQSEIFWFSGGHMEVITNPDTVLEPILAFHQKWEAGNASYRVDASAERIKMSNDEISISGQRKISGTALFIFIILIALATFGSEDLTCIGTGILCAQGIISLWAGILGCTVGIFVGDILLYFAGKYIGVRALSYAPFRWVLSKQTVENQREWFQKRGPALIFFSRFIPGTRLPTYFAAGLMKLPLRQFIFYFFLAALIWTPLIIGGAWYFGDWMFSFLEKYEKFSLWIIVGFLLSFWTMLKLGLPMLTYRGRRLQYSAWLRWSRWEFWPRWKFYPPVIIWILFLMLKYRSFRLPCIANPGMPFSGIANESKIEILNELKSSGKIAPFVVLKANDSYEDKWSKITAFQKTLKSSYPLVLKPDKGERGCDVQIIKSKDQLQKAVIDISDSILQEYVAGVEFGVFYRRYPQEKSGEIISITDKQYTKVTGDGIHDLEDLILRDKRAVCMAPVFLDRYKNQLKEILPAGQEFKLVEIGTHSRGSLFLDANALKTPELERAIDQTSRCFEGFYYGRYDLKSPDVASFKRGEFTILELNGLTSEPTHIYDPKHTLFNAYRTMFALWSDVFAISLQNKKAGFPLPTWKSVIRFFKEL